MNPDEIRRTWQRLTVPFGLGLIILLVSLLFHQFGSKRPSPQTVSFFSSVFGLMLSLFAGHKMIQFRRWLRNNGH